MGTVGAAFSYACFGFSHSLLFARFIAGGLSGNAAVVGTMIGEIADETNQGKKVSPYYVEFMAPPQYEGWHSLHSIHLINGLPFPMHSHFSLLAYTRGASIGGWKSIKPDGKMAWLV